MDWTHLLSFAFVATLLVISPGPNGVLIARTVPTSGRLSGFANVGGFVAAFYLHGALSVFGLSLILLKSAEAFFVVKMLGAAYLCWLGLMALRDAWISIAAPGNVVPAKRPRSLAVAFGEGFLTNALNPKVSMFYLAAFPQFIPLGETAIQSAFLLVVTHSAINALWFSLMIVLFAQLAAKARSGSYLRWLKLVTGVVFIGFGAKLASLRP